MIPTTASTTLYVLLLVIWEPKRQDWQRNSGYKIDGSALFSWSWGKVSLSLSSRLLTKCWRISS